MTSLVYIIRKHPKAEQNPEWEIYHRPKWVTLCISTWLSQNVKLQTHILYYTSKQKKLKKKISYRWNLLKFTNPENKIWKNFRNNMMAIKWCERHYTRNITKIRWAYRCFHDNPNSGGKWKGEKDEMTPFSLTSAEIEEENRQENDQRWEREEEAS